ncbi:unnamed protein product [Ceutorhynchus assimilis]|uniref:NADH dehydrogenase [ubiquinone] 1 alpha subcomplex subunit 11 n=1 Tax=Ceutorhynchus assimilis TaxID=467358 RepID=A0A9N9MDQ6_9CUCU|nr:unnamed protein product [Ceutorhynchus assimilis]
MSQKQPKRDPNRYYYFDTPDGEDVMKKLWCVVRPTLPTATLIGIGDVLLYSYPKGYLNSALRFTAVAAPIVGIASTFVLVTNGMTSLRKKDDKLNWFVGGFVAGSCVGLVKRNRMWGFNTGMLFGILGVIRKECAQRGYEISPSNPPRSRRGGATSCLMDLSLTAERPRNWTNGAESS